MNEPRGGQTVITLANLKSFFSPRHIAVVGATANNQWFGNFLANAEETGFDGRFYPVNPGTDEIYGVKAYRSIPELPDGIIDFAVLIVKSSLVLGALEEVGKKGVSNVLIVSSGFSETGAEGKRRQEELRSYCAEQGVIALGPNCLGFMNLTDKTSVFCGRAVEGPLRAGPVGVVGQSGAASELMMTKILQKAPGVSLYITTGNEVMLGAEDCIEYLLHDEHTRVVAAFIEEFRDTGKLKRVALQAAEKAVPIIVLKVGRSERGKQAALSHTGALAGNDGITNGFFSQHGIVRVDSIDEMAETAAAFSRLALPKGEGFGIVTFSGGLCGLYADLCEDCGISLPPLSDETVSRLRGLLPAFALPDNPLDVTGAGFLHGLKDVMKALVEDGNLDIIAPVCIPPRDAGDDFALVINESFMPFMDGGKPVVPIVFKEFTDYGRQYLIEKGFYFIERPDLGLRAVGHLIRYAKFLRTRGHWLEHGTRADG